MVRILSVLFVVLSLVGCSKERVLQERWDRAAEWEKDTLTAFGELPVQHGGRVKPLASFAHYKLIQLSGKSRLTVHLPEGHDRAKEKLDGLRTAIDDLRASRA